MARTVADVALMHVGHRRTGPALPISYPVDTGAFRPRPANGVGARLPVAWGGDLASRPSTTRCSASLAMR